MLNHGIVCSVIMTETAPTTLDCTPLAGLGSAQNPYDRLVSTMAKQHRLLSVHWELTYRCNETCSHCYLDVFKPNAQVAGELSLEQGQRFLDEAAAMGALTITFSGGEALVHRDFFALAGYARRKRFAVRIFSNGILINERLADRIAQLRPTCVEMSLYGAEAETHDLITGRRRSWELTTRAFGLLKERGVHTMMKTPLMHENVYQVQRLRELAGSLGAIFRYDTALTPKDNGDHAPLRHEMLAEDLAWLLRQEIPADSEPPTPIGESARSCSIGMHSLVMDPYGNIYPCVQTRIPAGNVLDRPLAEVWQAAIFAETSKLSFSELPICRTCELNLICKRCHATALESTGDLRAPSPSNCREALVKREVMIEKGMLPRDYPIPVHLQHGIPECLEGGSSALPGRHLSAATFVPLKMVTTRQTAVGPVMTVSA
jgi:radical SAM protein with 4Fe4S-binding SPASM domain